MKKRPNAGLVAALTLASAVVVIGVAGAKIAAARADQAPQPRMFSQDGQVHRWNVAHGVVGALTLGREVAPPDVPGLKALAGDGKVKAYAPELVLSCSSPGRGAVTTTSVSSGTVTVAAGDSVFQTTALERGEFPHDFFRALGAAPTVSVTQDGRTTTYKGPGRALTRHFQRYCATLPDRGAV